jgi:hypothetical protein
LKKNEKPLFISLWVILFLGVSLWYFRPQPETEIKGVPTMTLRPELGTWFSGGRITKSTGSQFHVELLIRPEYLLQLHGETRRILLGYQLLRGDSLLADRLTSCQIHSPVSMSEITLENPERVSPNEIVLYLAH